MARSAELPVFDHKGPPAGWLARPFQLTKPAASVRFAAALPATCRALAAETGPHPSRDVKTVGAALRETLRSPPKACGSAAARPTLGGCGAGKATSLAARPGSSGSGSHAICAQAQRRPSVFSYSRAAGLRMAEAATTAYRRAY
jgi:hypothetical protein